ncbi:hypothetical protein G9A89_000206 [Geosiphon pyriformis]|nr:hypothetical protein G9A89_000206 [Geosiphon pyriformis]
MGVIAPLNQGFATPDSSNRSYHDCNGSFGEAKWGLEGDYGIYLHRGGYHPGKEVLNLILFESLVDSDYLYTRGGMNVIMAPLPIPISGIPLVIPTIWSIGFRGKGFSVKYLVIAPRSARYLIRWPLEADAVSDPNSLIVFLGEPPSLGAVWLKSGSVLTDNSTQISNRDSYPYGIGMTPPDYRVGAVAISHEHLVSSCESRLRLLGDSRGQNEAMVLWSLWVIAL